MRITDRLHKQFAQEERARSRLQLQWSRQWLDWLRYVLLRSRGFFFRQSTQLLQDGLETAGIYLVAHASLAKLSGSFLVLNFMLGVFLEGISLVTRSAAVRGRKVPLALWAAFATLSLFISVGVVVTLHFGDFSYFGATAWAYVGLKTIISLVGLSFFIATAELQAKTRIYYPPWLSVIFLAASFLSMGAGNWLGSGRGYALIIGAFAAIQVIQQTVFYFFAKAAEKRARKQSSNLEARFCVSDLVRLCATLSHYLPLAAISALVWLPTSLHSIGQIIAWAWLLKAVVFKMIDRPFRAVTVDLLRAFQNRQWLYLENRTRLSFQTSLLFLGIALALCVTLLESGAASFAAFLLPWVALTSLNRIFYNRLSMLGLEEKLSKDFLLLKGSAVPALAILAAFNVSIGWAFLLIMLFETALLILNLRRYKELPIHHLAEYHYAQEFLERDALLSVSPLAFLTTFSRLSPILSAERIPQKFCLVKLATRYSTSKRMEHLLLSISKCLRKSDRMMALNGSEIVLWLGGADSIEPVLERLYYHFPLEIVDIREMKESELKSRLLGEQSLSTLKEPGLRGYSLLMWLTIQSNGTWWTLSDLGEWISLQKKADPLLSRQLFHHVRAARHNLIYDRLSHFNDDGTSAWVLQVPGVPTAVLLTTSGAQKAQAMVRELRNRLLSSLISEQTGMAQTHEPELNWTELACCTNYARGLPERHSQDVFFRSTGQTKASGEYVIGNAWSHGKNLSLIIKVKNKPTAPQDAQERQTHEFARAA